MKSVRADCRNCGDSTHLLALDDGLCPLCAGVDRGFCTVTMLRNCPKCGSRMYATQMEHGAEYGGGKPGCCWMMDIIPRKDVTP